MAQVSAVARLIWPQAWRSGCIWRSLIRFIVFVMLSQPWNTGRWCHYRLQCSAVDRFCPCFSRLHGAGSRRQVEMEIGQALSLGRWWPIVGIYQLVMHSVRHSWSSLWAIIVSVLRQASAGVEYTRTDWASLMWWCRCKLGSSGSLTERSVPASLSTAGNFASFTARSVLIFGSGASTGSGKKEREGERLRGVGGVKRGCKLWSDGGRGSSGLQYKSQDACCVALNVKRATQITVQTKKVSKESQHSPARVPGRTCMWRCFSSGLTRLPRHSLELQGAADFDLAGSSWWHSNTYRRHGRVENDAAFE